ncbi:MAG TPA: hypothetical protein VKH41_06150 [Myxococcota bacterium]|nr:hypothetical protein [Myxococcota bacterium]
MNADRPHFDRDLDLGDAELVRRIAESYRAPEPSAAERVALRARIDARLQRRSVRRLWVAGAATAGVAAAIALLRAGEPAVAPAPDAAADEALLALAAPAGAEEEALPDDYQAIEDLLLEGEGV